MMALPRIGERYVMIVSLIALSKLSPPPSNSPIQIAICLQRFTKKDDQQPFTVCMEMQKFSPRPPRRNGQNVPNQEVLVAIWRPKFQQILSLTSAVTTYHFFFECLPLWMLARCNNITWLCHILIGLGWKTLWKVFISLRAWRPQ